MVVSSWSASETGRALRGLVADGWSFHRLNSSDVTNTTDGTMLWDIGGATALTRHDEASFQVDLLDVSEPEADDAIRALIDVAIDRDAEHFAAWTADLKWMVDALVANGCETFPNGIYAMAL